MNVFDFAIDLERSGRNFYGRMAALCENAGVGSIFMMMAEDEQGLMEKLEEMKSRVAGGAHLESRTLDSAGGAIFGDMADATVAKRIQTDLEAYEYVMKIEKSICRLYEDAAEKEPAGEVRRLLQKIAEEDRREFESIRSLYDFVNAPNEYLAWGEFSNQGEFHNFGRDEG